jgi:hypothetical protein
MDRKKAIHSHISDAANELLEFIKERMSSAQDGWVPASEIKQSLDRGWGRGRTKLIR